MSNQVTYAKATEVISALLNATRVLSIEVVGSVARQGHGNDLDLVLVVDPIAYATFIRDMNIGTDGYDDYYFDFKEARCEAAMRIIGLHPLAKAWFASVTRGLSYDLHLMPRNWQAHITEIQAHLPHEDANFVRNIAQDAIRVETVRQDGIKRAKWSFKR